MQPADLCRTTQHRAAARPPDQPPSWPPQFQQQLVLLQRPPVRFMQALGQPLQSVPARRLLIVAATIATGQPVDLAFLRNKFH